MAVDYLLQSGYNAFDNADNHYASVSMGYQILTIRFMVLLI